MGRRKCEKIGEMKEKLEKKKGKHKLLGKEENKENLRREHRYQRYSSNRES